MFFYAPDLDNYTQKGCSTAAGMRGAAVRKQVYRRYHMKKEDRLRAQDYCLYMIAGSYFGGCFCTTTWNAEKCLLQYHELGTAGQVEGEENCIRLLEGKVLREIPSWLLLQPVSAAFVTVDGTQGHELRLQNRYLLLRFFLSCRGRYPVMEYEVLFHRQHLMERQRKMRDIQR